MKTKEKLIAELCLAKAESNNTIDLNAYAIGLSDMFDKLHFSTCVCDHELSCLCKRGQKCIYNNYCPHQIIITQEIPK